MVKKRKVKKGDEFDWGNYGSKYEIKASLYKYRCSVKCKRASENPPLTISGTGRFEIFERDGKSRWMISFKKRSERDEMLIDGKSHMGRKVKKETNRIDD